MERVAHYIKGNFGNALPGTLITVEVASKQVEGSWDNGKWAEEFATGAAIKTRFRSGRRSTNSSSLLRMRQDFWDFLRCSCEVRRSTWVLGIRMSRLLTLLHGWEKFCERELTWFMACEECEQTQGRCKKHRFRGYAVTGDPPTIIVCRLQNAPGTIKFIDLLNYYQGPLDKLSQCRGTAWPENPEPWADLSVLGSWSVSRAKLVHSFMLDWLDTVKEHRLGNFADTVSKQAWNAWRHTGMHTKVVVHTNSEALKLEREGYYGGRNELYFIGEVGRNGESPSCNSPSGGTACLRFGCSEISCFDFNWHYPAVMAQHSFPAKIILHRRTERTNDLSVLQREILVIARVRLNTASETFPVKHKGKLIFAKGRFTTVLCGPELERAIRTNSVTDVFEVAYYEGADLFSEWVKRLYDLRLALRLRGQEAQEKIIKSIGDSLYGKFGQRSSAWERSPETSTTTPFGEWWSAEHGVDELVRYRSIGWLVEKAVERGEHRESCPAIAAFITAYGREKLLSAMVAAGRHNVYYCDTDSIWTNSYGANNLRNAGLLSADDLGLLRLEGLYDSVRFNNLKYYNKGTEMVAGGVISSAKRIGNHTFTWEQEQRMDRIIAAGNRGSLGVRQIQVTLSPNYQHGKVTSSGWVEPITLEE